MKLAQMSHGDRKGLVVESLEEHLPMTARAASTDTYSSLNPESSGARAIFSLICQLIA